MDHDDVHDRLSFAQYAVQLAEELNDPKRRAEWENVELSSFLEALAAWARNWDTPAHDNPWRHAAEALTAATVYE